MSRKRRRASPSCASSTSRSGTSCPSFPGPRSSPPTFFFNDTAPTEIYTLSLHDALPISNMMADNYEGALVARKRWRPPCLRSEEHTSELQSRENLVCRLLLETKKTS